jgi:hypothetical protein
MQFFIGCSTESLAVAAASSLQLRAISNFGTWSATATTNCELKIIIEIEIGIFGLPLVFGSTALQKASRTGSSFSFYKTNGTRLCENRQVMTEVAV